MENFKLSGFNFELVRVAIVDDHTAVAEGFESIINGSGVAGVIGKAFSVAGCMELLAQSKVDLLLLDISLADGNGIDLFLQIKPLYPDLKVIALTCHSEISIIKRALEVGFSGYIRKNSTAADIIEGIRAVASGELFLCKETQRLLQEPDCQKLLLSRREDELLRLIVSGKSNIEIADSMKLGYETIKSYRKRLMLKLNTSNTAELVRVAIEENLV
ncbi:MAG: response regulator transcription factor [Lentimicrobiaceae bacterium]|nr:response regulator transcription factor [Lentimicrobiaceae bacterium]